MPILSQTPGNRTLAGSGEGNSKPWTLAASVAQGFGRVFARLNPDQLERCFQAWMQALAKVSGGQLIALDASRIRRLALNLLRLDKTCRAGIKGKRLPACLKDEYLIRILSQGIQMRLP